MGGLKAKNDKSGKKKIKTLVRETHRIMEAHAGGGGGWWVVDRQKIVVTAHALLAKIWHRCGHVYGNFFVI